MVEVRVSEPNETTSTTVKITGSSREDVIACCLRAVALLYGSLKEADDELGDVFKDCLTDEVFMEDLFRRGRDATKHSKHRSSAEEKKDTLMKLIESILEEDQADE